MMAVSEAVWDMITYFTGFSNLARGCMGGCAIQALKLMNIQGPTFFAQLKNFFFFS